MFEAKGKRKEQEEKKEKKPEGPGAGLPQREARREAGEEERGEEGAAREEEVTVAETEDEQEKQLDVRELVEQLRYRKKLAALEKKDARDDRLPRATFETVHYEPRGVSETSVKTQFGKSPRDVFNSNIHNCKAFEHVSANYVIPADFDKSLRFGPRSGMCHEERAVIAYEAGLLQPKSATAAQVKVCRTCGAHGHFGTGCPTLLED